uniref:non-specific serine/threonine protein kinase n=1 Tax=Alexandrium monilatum TaxID=311494 RepID=A0A7S4SMS6_9DINO
MASEESWATVVAKGRKARAGVEQQVQRKAAELASAVCRATAAAVPKPRARTASGGGRVRSHNGGGGRGQSREARSASARAGKGDDGCRLLIRPKLVAEGSTAGLLDRQEMEFQAIQAIYQDEGAVRELELGGEVEEDEGEDSEAEKAPGPRPSTPVRRYRVRLSACGGAGAGGSDRPHEARERQRSSPGPTAELEVCYGRLYPLETPALRLRSVDGLSKQAREELCRQVREEVSAHAGEECVYQACRVISEILRLNYDPSADLPLHERMQRRDAEEAQRREAAERAARARDERRTAEEWDRQMRAERERNLLYQKKKRASARVGEAGLGGNLDFLPEDSESPVQPSRPTPANGPAAGAAGSAPLSAAGPDISQRFAGDLPGPGSEGDSLGEDSSSGFIVFEASVVESPPEFARLPAAARSPAPAEPSPAAPKRTLAGVWPRAGAARREGAAKAAAAAPRRQSPVAMAAAGGGVAEGQAAPRSQAEGGPFSASAGRYASDFQELRFLGRGGFGAVTKVRHIVDRQVYAIKRITLSGPGSGRERLMEECTTLPRLYHPHIVRYYQAWIETERVELPAPTHASRAAGPHRRRAVRQVSRGGAGGEEADDWLSLPGASWANFAPEGLPGGASSATVREHLYIQMEFCDGTTLREVINSGELQKDEALIWKLFRQVLDALAYVHSKGLIHRDLKPPNVFLSRADGGHAKLGDFGLTTEATPVSPELRPAATPASTELRPTAGGSVATRERKQSTCVGTTFYMAPEVRQGGAVAASERPRRAGGATGGREELPDQASAVYDQSADMFSLGVVFFEMWHPPFATSMERAHVLGRLAEGLGGEARPESVAAMLPKGVPPEVAEILTSLLSREPRRRMAAEYLLNESGLLPAGAFDPQVQRLLKALENPSSTESVALLNALFDRSEESAKDVSFFDQLFRGTTPYPESEAEAEARDSLQQLVRELCRKHGATYEVVPLLRPSRRAAERPEGAGTSAPSTAVLPRGRGPPVGCQLVDAGNTLLELRANLTEPIARAAAARAASEEAMTDETRPPLPHARRQYHLGTIYRKAPASDAFAMEQSGHPREVSSAVVQFLWWPTCRVVSREDRAPSSPRHCVMEAALAKAHEAELLHLLAEILAAAGLGGPGGRAELQLSDTRLLPLLLECAAQRVLREPPPSRSPEPSHGPAGHGGAGGGDRGSGGEARVDRLRGRFLEALRLTLQQQHVVAGPDVGALRRGRAHSPSPLERASPGLEHAAAQLASLLGGTGGSSGGAAEGTRHALWLLSELEEHFAGPSFGNGAVAAGCSNAAAANAAAGANGALEALPAAEQLRDVLSGLRSIARCVEGLVEVSVDALQPVDAESYGPGLAFRVLLRDGGVSPVVCAGGRIDRLVGRYTRLHGVGSRHHEDSEASQSSSSSILFGRGAPLGISAELALDKLAAALLQAAQAAPPAGAGAWRRGGRSSTAVAPAVQLPWWRQIAACWAYVLVGVASEQAAVQVAVLPCGEILRGAEAVSTSEAAEATRVARGFWRLGLRCDVQPADAGSLDARLLVESHQQLEAPLQTVWPDFVVTFKRYPGTEGNGAGQELPSVETGSAAKKAAGSAAGARGGGGGRFSASSAPAQSQSQAAGEAGSTEIVRYFVRGVSEHGNELLERATKDAGGRDGHQFDERQRLFDFFERLSRRAVSRHFTLTLPVAPEH